ncbi:FAD:protein FMN transferase [Celeribacter halophilus]|uniref:FAD:protein FMN transferase n=1 Tax=Celeribacter halophilus TaxID=576117 RepID=UPI003A94ED2B
MQETQQITRRRFLTIAAASCLGAAGGLPTSVASAAHWRGVALGADAQIILDHPDATRLIAMARAEIRRLEAVFSLYDANSELSRLNRAGHLEAPAFELLDCLALCRQVHLATEGRFDPTVQPLWQVLAEAAVQGHVPVAGALAAARSAIGFDRVMFEAGIVHLGQGQRLTLNGIAQGYVADRIAALLGREGIEDVLIDTGEIVALGSAPQHDGWPVTIAGESVQRHLRNRALATSAYQGTEIRDGEGHILDPRHGNLVQAAAQVSVSAPTAAMADGLSTGLVLTSSQAQAEQLLRNAKEARLESFML